VARERFGIGDVFYFPLDFAFAVRAYLRVLRPKMLILAETEFWPRTLFECQRYGVLIAVVNARVSDRSYAKYRRFRVFWRRFLRFFALFLAQSEEDISRLRSIGAPADRVRLGGNLKYDIRATSEAAATAGIRSALRSEAKLLVCGSTLEGEERLLLDAWPELAAAEPELRMVLAPRHPERFGAVAQLLERSGTPWMRRSGWNGGGFAAGSVLLLDSIGELASVYSLATVAFVGGSLAAAGGHNPLEPAQFGVPILMGPHYENFREIVEKLRAADAIRIVEAGALGGALLGMLRDRKAALEMGGRAEAVFAAEAGATTRAVDAVLALLNGAAA
jgi:3-deoxy-D-manno-octulosonic-acid transferase